MTLNTQNSSPDKQAFSKVPEVFFGFSVAKIAAATLGETGGDWVSMSLKLGYLIGSASFSANSGS